MNDTTAYSRKSRRRRRLLAWAAAIVLLGVGWVAYIQWLIHSVQIRAPAAHAEVAIVLGASLWNDKPSPGLRERLDHAYGLYEAGVVDRLIVSGGLDANGATITEAEGMKRYLTERGVPADRIVPEPEATSTYENLLYSKRIMDREGWGGPIIVTHRYHGARAYDIARFVGFVDATVSLTDSQTMWMPYHEARETLAYTKWLADKLVMMLSGKRS